MYSWVDILFSLSFYRGCEGKGSSYQIERKDSWSHYVSDTNSITRSVACASQHFLSFISAAALPPSTLLWKSCTTEDKLHCDRSLQHFYFLNKRGLLGWKEGPPEVGGPSTTLPQPASRHSEFQAILETTLVLPGKWIHLHAGRVGHPSSQGTEAPAFGTLSDCTLVVHLYPLW